MWPTLSTARRDLLSRWIPDPKSEKATRRIALLAAAVLEADGETALGWLSRLIPQNPKGKLTRELCKVLSSAFFGAKPLRFIRLGDAAGHPENLLKVLKALVHVAVDEHYAVETRLRYRLIEDTLIIISQKDLAATDESKLIVARIEIEMKKWPQALIDQLVDTLEKRIPNAELLLKRPVPKRDAVPSRPDDISHAQQAEPQLEEKNERKSAKRPK